MGTLAFLCTQDVSKLSPVQGAGQRADSRPVPTQGLLMPTLAQHDTGGDGEDRSNAIHLINE